MSQQIHLAVTDLDPSADAGGRRHVPLRVRGKGHVLPPPDDPFRGHVLPPLLEGSGKGNVLPPPDDPRQRLSKTAARRSVRGESEWGLEKPEDRAVSALLGAGGRNTHGAVSTDALPVVVSGAPDRAWTFELQILQRLPAGVEVELETTPLLAALLINSRPELRGTPSRLILPKGPCLIFENIRLHAGACHEGTLRLRNVKGVEVGHGLVIRQLDRGREIGCVAWYFTAA